MKILPAGLLLSVLGGCSAINDSLPSRSVVAEAAKEAALEPRTWVPLAGAAVLGVTGWDQDISDWAARETPIFGSQDRARAASDSLQYGLVGGMLVSSVFAPTEAGDGGFPTARVAANLLAFGSANATVAGLKEIVRRERPDDTDRRSFPSGHAVAAFTSSSLIEQNVDQTIASPVTRGVVTAGTIGLAAATSWARVEGNKHYPVDILVSAAIGHFFATSFYRALVAPEDLGPPPISVEAGSDGLALRFSRRF
ncbi:MAG: phosphatase PAP2 family protein [Geminicoccaceae bacterium]